MLKEVLVSSLIKEEVAMPVRISKKIRCYFWLVPVIDRANSVYDIAGRQMEAPVVQQLCDQQEEMMLALLKNNPCMGACVNTV